ncbi:MAG TPA: GGDEF domain-containing protein [Candidatus Solibacter sp.]|nr:GGDEF domain-containing protein [Candidatus Solibacter sp.]
MNKRNDPLKMPVESASDREIVENLRRIEKRDWWIWANSIFVMLLLTGALVLFSLPSFYRGAAPPRMAPIFKMRFSEAIFGLVALVLLFNIYTVYQVALIKRLRRQLAERQHHSLILRELAMVDALTGLYNRRFAEQRLAAEVPRSERKGHPLVVVLFDLDEFKHINDTYGHAAGDLVLQEFAGALNRAIRSSDLAVRMGGDEFLLILPECNHKQLQLVLHRLIPREVSWAGRKFPIKYSVGWKEYAPGDQPETMLAAADQALYENKRATKNPRIPEKISV